MENLTERLRTDLTAALRARERETVRVLRTVLSAIANAEAQPHPDATKAGLVAEGDVAGAVRGLGTTEVARRDLDERDLRAVLMAERDERLASADTLRARGATEAAESLRTEAAIVDRYLG